MNLLLNGDLIFEACMIVMKGYLIDIEDPNDRKFRKNNNDLKFLYILIMSKFGRASKDFFFINLTYKDFWFENNRIELIWELRFDSYWL